MKIKASISIFLLIFLIFSLNNKNIISCNGEWNKIYDCYGGLDDIIKVDENYFVLGWFAKELFGDKDIFLMKIDEEGNEIWNKTYDRGDEDGGWEILKTIDGFLITGYTFSHGKGEECWLIKVDEEGNEIWNKTYGGDYAFHTIEDERNYLTIGVKNYKIWLIKIDEEGNEIWNKTYDGEVFGGVDILKTDDGYLIGGNTFASGINKDILLIKIDKEGNEIWNRTYSWGWDWEWTKRIIEAEDGYLILGETISTPTGWNDVYLIKIDKEGNEIWSKTYGGYQPEGGEDIIKIDEGYAIIGSTSTYKIGEADVWLLKIDKEGNEIWNKSFGWRAGDWGGGIIYEENNYVIAATFCDIVWINNEPKSAPHPWIIKCNDLSPPKMKIIKPKEGYLYIFDREICPKEGYAFVIGGITIQMDVIDPLKMVNRVEIYIYVRKFEYEPRAVIYSPPYEWKWDERVIKIRDTPPYIRAGAFYGNTRAVAPDVVSLYIINL
ncbi:MAG: hypothetical protein QXW78_02250 [Candidatus Thermoplasmatota archaeon]